MKKLLLATILWLSAVSAALAQGTILQGGPWAPGHAPMYVGPQGFGGQAIVQDGGGSAGGPLGVNPSEIGITSRSPTGSYPSANSGNGPNAEHGCFYDGPTTAAYHYLCFDPDALGGGLISYGAGGGAPALPLQLSVNGTIFTPSNGSTFGVWYATQYGVKCDGVTNDSQAAQTLVNKIVASGGGTLVLPTGKCILPSTLTLDFSHYSSGLKPVVSIAGQGPSVSQIITNGLAAAPSVNIIGSGANDEVFLDISGVSILGNIASTSIGLQTNYTSYLHLRNVIIEGFATGWSATNLEQSSIEHSLFSFNTNGVALNGASGSGNLTGSNSITFYDSTITSNTATGLTVKDFAAVAYIGGLIGFNGAVGVMGDYGAIFEDTAGGSYCGYNTITFMNTAFEGNSGEFDLGLYTQFCPGATLTVQGSSFFRHATQYATNNIALLGSVSQNMRSSANTFLYDAAYVPNSGRPTIASTNALGIAYDDGTSYFQSAVEQPAFSIANFGPQFSVAGAAALISETPSKGALSPLEIRASALYVDQFSVAGYVCNSSAGLISSSLTPCVSASFPTTSLTGTLQAAQEPAHTGDMTNSAGSLATTVVKVDGVAYGSSPSTNTVPVVTGSNTVTYEVVPVAAGGTGSTGSQTWTPTDASGASLALTVNLAKASLVGKTCTVEFNITYPSTASGAQAAIAGLPCTAQASFSASTFMVTDGTSGTNYSAYIGPGGTSLAIASLTNTTSATANSTLSGHQIWGTVNYISQ